MLWYVPDETATTLSRPAGTLRWPSVFLPQVAMDTLLLVRPRELTDMLVSPPPSPPKVPVRFTPVRLFVTTVPGSCAGLSVPVMFAAATELAVPAMAAFAARSAYGVGVSF